MALFYTYLGSTPIRLASRHSRCIDRSEIGSSSQKFVFATGKIVIRISFSQHPLVLSPPAGNCLSVFRSEWWHKSVRLNFYLDLTIVRCFEPSILSKLYLSHNDLFTQYSTFQLYQVHKHCWKTDLAKVSCTSLTRKVLYSLTILLSWKVSALSI